jgi:hypothetical protein
VSEPLLVEITDRESADGQLKTALELWFNDKDRSSIHTLAVAAQGVLNQMCKERRIRPSQINALIESRPPAFRKIMRTPQNFFKHGSDREQRLKGVVRHSPMLTELILLECLSMYQRLFGTLSSLMKLFAVRYSLFDPRAFPSKIEVEGIEIEQLKRFTRREFLEKVLPRLRVKVGDLSAMGHSGSPPE